MQTVSCPSCGAPVQFRSHASVLAVCEYCRATVLKEAGAVRDLGKMSEVLEDYSRIQVGSSGVHGGRSFTVVGRIQLRYDAGMWNEWYVLFDDGTDGWLGDASGQYVMTTRREPAHALPAFEAIRVTNEYDVGFGPYVAADKRVAKCTGGQGELPFRVGEGWEARVADFRRGPSFATLDYSDGTPPLLYAGTAVTLEGMKCQLLRDDEQIKASAGKYRGKVDVLQCRSCGTSIRYLPGLASNCVCPACSTRMDASSPKVEVLLKGEQHERVQFTLSLGATAKIGAQAYQVLGAMRREDDEGESWDEYLLYSAQGPSQGPFFWLVETGEGWSRSDVLDDWPTPPQPSVSTVRVDKVEYERTWEYPARVQYAAGAFNWRVKAGDVVRVTEYEHGRNGLAAEYTDEELSWSRSSPVADDQVRAWFGLKAANSAARKVQNGLTQSDIAWRALLWILGLNFIPLLFNFTATIFVIAAGLVALFLPMMLAPDKKS